MNGKTLISDDLSWKINTAIGEGGFGKVYKATSLQDKSNVAIKLIPKSEGARRELLFEDLSDASNIVEIIATGEHEDYYFIVMNLASESLREKMQEDGVSYDEALIAIRNIAESLESIRTSVVHRDIKPDNILLLNNIWCLSDFGIARFIEQSTATETFKRAHSAPYTAPERWRGERATSASDVYSLGVTAFEVIEGKLPFSEGDLGDKHQNDAVPTFSASIDHRVARLVYGMLAKSPKMRPTPSRIMEVLDSIGTTEGTLVSDELLALQNASKSLSSIRQEEEAQAEKRRLEASARAEFVAESANKLNVELQSLKDALTSNAAEGSVTRDPSSMFFSGRDSWNFVFGDAEIRIDEVSRIDATPFAVSSELPFDVTAFTTIKLLVKRQVVRSHSIWFSDMIRKDDYGCYEIAFMEMFSTSHDHRPFALRPNDKGVDVVFRPVMTTYQIARNPLRIEDNQNAFVSRWVKYLVAVVNGSYSVPSGMPEEVITEVTRR